MDAFDFAREKWVAFTRQQRVLFLAGLALITALLIGGGLWITRDDYQVLFSDLSGQDAGAMVAELDRMKVPYRLSGNGTTILVERDTVYKTRLKLMAKGLDLHGTVGFEIFNNTDFGTTEFAQKVNYQRAMQGELARTIMGFDEIKFARVHLVLPDSGLFKRQNSKPKASVSVSMKDGAQLEPEQIIGIQRLVAASVPEIQPSSVTIVDQHGTAVSGSTAAGDMEQNEGTRLEARKRIEEYMARKIVGVLDRAIGPGKAIVSVNAQINYDQTRVTREDIIPLPETSGQNVGAIVRRRDSNQSGDSYGDSVAQGGFGRASSGPSSSSTEVEFVNGRKVENVVGATGNIKRLSVGVLVPGVSDPVELAKLKEVITMAVGIDDKRGDAIAVYNVVPQGGALLAPTEPQAMSNVPSATVAHVRSAPTAPLSLWSWELACAVAVLIAVLACGFAMSKKAPRRLSVVERERMLRELLQWQQADRAKEST